ncbi:YraN family protein [Leeia sp. IMCC25680]|uniref:UPF0102 protein HF682_14430 n=1 Tax=Leeia aquatica TaxID=2725557 RepID=A0A847RYZ6_9NEIS|nr:YraN family protein [Leeia aquatica]
MDGAKAEAEAANWLQKQGLQLLARNYRCRYGEIDLIMRDGHTLVFVEVRARSSSRFGGAAASVGPRKQQKLWLTAQHYLASQPQTPACRFDVLALEGTHWHWVKDAIHGQ